MFGRIFNHDLWSLAKFHSLVSIGALFLLLITPELAHSQEVIITDVKRVSDKVEIYYNIVDEKKDHSYSLQLYSSLDNYVQPLQQVEGDVGIDIKVGDFKKIIWNAKEELGEDFDERITLELKGSLYVPFITVDGLEEGRIFKREKPYELAWSGGRGDNVLSIELYKDNNVVHVFEERPNTGNTTLIIPSDVRPGKNYWLKITDSRNSDEVVYTPAFNIKRKYPLGLKVGLGVLVGGVIGYIIGSSSGEEETIGQPPQPKR